MARDTGRDRETNSFLSRDRHWWLFCLLIFVLKFLLLALDPLPKLSLGDSNSYIWTGLTGWIPPDRSFLYGFVIRWLAVGTESLMPLVIMQVLASGLTALLVASLCRSIFHLSPRMSFLFGFLSCLDPLQIVWERYVLAEAFSLFLYALALERSLTYLKQRRIWDLVIVQALSLLAIGFRMSYLLVVQINAVLLPLIAFGPGVVGLLRQRSSGFALTLPVWRRMSGHCAVSISLMLLLDRGYQVTNGWLSHREPAFLYATGRHLLAMWAPAVKPADAPDSRLANVLAQGDEYEINDLSRRNNQRFGPDYLIDRWEKIDRDEADADKVAKQTALHALVRDPLGVISLGGQTFLEYWDVALIHESGRTELVHGELTPAQVSLLAERFHWSIAPDLARQPLTILQRYCLASWPYYYVALLSPLLAAACIFLLRDSRYLFLLFVHASLIVATTCLFATQASVRYLQPLSLVTLLIIAAWVQSHAEGAVKISPVPSR